MIRKNDKRQIFNKYRYLRPIQKYKYVFQRKNYIYIIYFKQCRNISSLIKIHLIVHTLYINPYYYPFINPLYFYIL